MKKLIVIMGMCAALSGCGAETVNNNRMSIRESYQLLVEKGVYPNDIEIEVQETIDNNSRFHMDEFFKIERAIRNRCSGGWRVEFLLKDSLIILTTFVFPIPYYAFIAPGQQIIDQAIRAKSCEGYTKTAN